MFGRARKNKLSVNGKIRAHEIKVETDNWPDYVFEASYRLEALEVLEQYIKTNKHLPELPPASMIEKNGLELGEMSKVLLKKIEELTLHLIIKNREISVIKAALTDYKVEKEQIEVKNQKKIAALEEKVDRIVNGLKIG